MDEDVLVEVGNDHLCCGVAYERGELVEMGCSSYLGAGAQVRFIEARHGGVSRKVRGRVVDIVSVQTDGSARSILRLPSGRALCGVDEDDDGHLEDPWTGEPVERATAEFLITVRPALARRRG